MKKLLITGAYGLVGSTICKILERDYPMIEVTKIKFDGIYKYGETFEDKDYDFIIHAAGYGQPQKFSNEKIETIKVNTIVTNDLIKYCLNPNGKFLFISTSEIYSGSQTPHSEDVIGTTTPQHPRACYIEGKRCGEAICMAYKEQGYDIKIARLALAYGPGTKKGDTRVLNQFIEQALTNKEIHMKDDGSSERTYIYVEDAAKILLDILFKGKDVVYNVGGFSTTNIKDLAFMIAFMTGARAYPGNIPLEGSPDNVRLDMKKVVEEFNPCFTPMYRGLSNTIDYQKKLYGIN